MKAAVRAHWQAQVTRRARRRSILAIAALAAAAIFVVAVGLALSRRTPAGSSRDTVARAEMVLNDAWIRGTAGAPPERAASIRPGDAVAAGSEVGSGNGGRLAIRMASGCSVRLDSNTRVRILSKHALALDVGAVYVDSVRPDDLPADPVEVRTPLGIVRDVGTQYEVRRMDASLRIRVREGAVSLDGRDGPLEVAAGHELRVDEDGRASRGDLAAFGGEWDWIEEITPMLDIEGRPLREFLDWIARERGLRLRFSGKGLADSASEIMLNGSIASMTLDQALASVLPACRMTHRIEGNDLFVEPLAGDP